MTKSREIIKIALFDIDSCVLSYMSGSKHSISEDLIKKYKELGCQAWGLVTNRHYSRLASKTKSVYPYHIRKFQTAEKKQEKQENHHNDLFTVRVAENLEKLLGEKPLAVSTADDRGLCVAGIPLEDQCGVGFEYIIKPFETQVMENNKNQHPLKQYSLAHDLPFASVFPHFGADLNDEIASFSLFSKNPQLLQAAHMARKKFGPNALIQIYYFDNERALCEDVSNIPMYQWPENVGMTSFLYDCHDKRISDLEKPVAMISKPSQQEEKSYPSSQGGTASIMREMRARANPEISFVSETTVKFVWNMPEESEESIAIHFHVDKHVSSQQAEPSNPVTSPVVLSGPHVRECANICKMM
jgi:hypothetical protein